MNAGGWIVMLLSVGGMTALFATCILKIVRAPNPSEQLHSQRDRPPDVDDDA